MKTKILALFLLVILFTGCSQNPKALSLDNANAFLYETTRENATLTQKDVELFQEFCPIFVIEQKDKLYNRIGEPKIKRGPQNKLEAFVDPAFHTIYVQKRDFFTQKGQYTNLIYRVHFEKVPYGLRPFQITAGKNVGLLVIITLNEKKLPVLITSVHTCGCYISMIPTNYTPPDFFPSDWKETPKVRYGERYPAMICYPSPLQGNVHPVFFLRHATHRVSDIYVESTTLIEKQYPTVGMTMVPMESLDDLPIQGEDKTLSFYYQDLSKGFVRNSLKPFEFLFISWWAFDPNVGNDKKYAPSSELRKQFYTSLNPAYWRESDLWNFPIAAKFWGWEL